MATKTMRQDLLRLSDDTKARIGALLDEFRQDIALDHQDLLQEISFKVGLLASVIVEGDMSAADVESEWIDCRARTSDRRRRRADKDYREVGK